MAERSPLDDATDLLKATTGFYPHLRRNRTVQDPEAAKNIPVSQARGMVAGLLGLPADTINMIGAIRNAGRSDKPFSEVPYGSEHFLDTLPLKDESPMGKAMGALGSFTPPVGTALKGAKAAGMGGLELINRGMFGEGPLRNFVPQHQFVMKPSNKANWLSGPNIHVPESDMWRFKTQPIAGETPAQRIPHHEELLKDPTLNQDQLDRVKYQLEQTKGEAALDKWADNALMGYFKGQLASPEDPVRLFIDKNYANIEAKFAKDQERAAKMAQRAEAELDPRKQANMKRQADTMLVQAKDDRDIAMQNISHLPPEMLRDIELDPKSYIKEERVKAGYPAEGMGTTDPSRRWEHQADEAVKVTRAGDIQGAMDLQPKIDKALQEQYAVHYKMGDAFGNLLREKGLDEATVQSLVKSMPRDQKAEAVGMLDELQKADSNYLRLLDQDRSFPKFAAQDNPQIAKLDPETKMYSGYMGDLGFEHVMDVLRQDLAAQRIRPDQLNKLSVEQAVKRTQEYNLDLAKKINADRASARSNLPVYKEYPEGYKWVQLNQPGNFAAESQAMGHSVKGYEPSKKHPEWVEGSGDEGSSSYGLGGWEAIKSGRAKVYSLIDSRGAPHTTIEVASGAHPIGYSFKGASKELPETFEYNRNFDEGFPRPTEEQKQTILSRAQDIFKNNSNIERMDAFQMAANEVLGELPAEIRQIKGKGNAKPIADYIPYVQDFVKSGKWTDVRDLPNTDLVKYGNEYKSLGEVEGMFKPRVESAMKYLEEHPALETHRQANKAYNEYRGPIPSPEYSSLDYNRGVTVHPNIPYTYNELKAILKDPASFSGRNDEIYDTLSRNLDRIDELKKHYGELPPVEGMKRGGVVISNNPDTMMLEVNNQKLAKGGKVVKFVEDVAPAAMEKLSMMFGNKLPLNMNAAEVENLAKRFPAPSVDRINMNYKDVTKRVPELTEAAQKLQAGELDRETYAKLVQAHKPVTPYDFVPKPATAEEARGALREDARDLYGIPSKTLEAGSPVGLRLDIPAYRDSGVWVPTIHEQDAGFGAGKKIGHESVASVLNPEFGMSEKAALSIASGKPKGTIATIKGDWNPTNEAEAVAKAKEFLKHPEWRQVGMDPERHSFFYDRETMAPVVNAEEVIQIGPLVLAKNPKYGKPEDFKYAKGGLAHMAGGGSEDDTDLTKPFFGGAGTKKYAAAKKRAEEVEPITERYPKTSAAVMGLMGTPPDEMGFSVLNPEYKDIMEVADPAFYAGTALGVAPLMKAFKAPAMALGRAGEKYAERVVPQIMERGGVGADILGGLAQGTRSYAYLPHTEKNPNPLVGSRYKTQHVGNLTPKFDFDVQAEQGSSVMSNPWDLTSRGEKVLEVSDIPMSNQMITEGGHDFARDIANIKANIGGASGRQIAERMQDRVNDATFANLFDKGTGRVFTMPSTMDVKGSHFSTMPTDLVMDIFQQRGLKPKDVERITDDLRTFVFETEKGKFRNAAPVGSPEFLLQLRQGGKGFSAGDLRKGLMDRMSKSEYQKMLGFNIEDVYGAIGDQTLKGLPKGFVGNTMIETSPFAGLKPATHQSYDTANMGKYAGSMPSMPLELMMPDLFRAIEINYLKNPKYQKLTPMQLRTMIVNTIEKRGNVISQPINQRVVDNVMRYKQGLAQGHFQPNDYEGIMKFMQSTGGYKDGGAVHKAEGGDITGDDLIIEERPL